MTELPVNSAVFIDDTVARSFFPFSGSRPLCEVRVGALLIRERWAHVLKTTGSSFVSSPWLEVFTESGAASPCRSSDSLRPGDWVVNSRSLPVLTSGIDTSNASVITVAGRVAAVRIARSLPISEVASATMESLAGPVSGSAVTTERLEVSGRWLDGVWDLISTLNDFLADDIRGLVASEHFSGSFRELRDEGGRTPAISGDNAVWIEEGAHVEPFVSFDTTEGPVLLRRGSRIHSFTRIIGPCYVGEGSSVAGDKVANCSIGPVCRVHGEVSSSIFIGYSNKGHDGFVGHSVVGRWVNLGAGTITSNLKNTYGTVSLWTPDGPRDTGLQFLGTLFGDHVKTGIGLRLTTGCVIGTGANLFDAMPPKYVAPFTWGSGPGQYTRFERGKFAATAARMMRRRGVDAGEEALAYFETMYEHALEEPSESASQ